MSRLIIHPVSQKHLNAHQAHPFQSLLLTGGEGAGLASLAKQLAGKQLSAELHPLTAKGEHTGNGTISAETIRALYEQTRTQHTSKRVIIIDDADRMSHSAQAAFLKLLEEPNSSTHFILTSHKKNDLLTTIRSRVQEITILPILKEQTTAFLESQGIVDTTKQTQLRFLAEGRPAEIYRLIHDENYFTQKVSLINDARRLLQGTPYEQLTVIHAHKADRDVSLSLVTTVLQILKHSNSTKPSQQLIARMALFLDIRSNLESNYSVQLQLLRAVL